MSPREGLWGQACPFWPGPHLLEIVQKSPHRAPAFHVCLGVWGVCVCVRVSLCSFSCVLRGFVCPSACPECVRGVHVCDSGGGTPGRLCRPCMRVCAAGVRARCVRAWVWRALPQRGCSGRASPPGATPGAAGGEERAAGGPAAHVGPAPPPAAHPRPPPPGGSRDKWRRGRRALSPERRRAALGPGCRRGLGARGPVTARVPAPSRPCPPGAAAPRPAVPAAPRSAWAPAPLCACARARACLRVPGACAPLPGGGPEPTCRRRQLRVRVSVPRRQPCRPGCAPGAGGRGQAAKFFGGAWLTFLGDPRSCVSGGGDLVARSWCPGCLPGALLPAAGVCLGRVMGGRCWVAPPAHGGQPWAPRS